MSARVRARETGIGWDAVHNHVIDYEFNTLLVPVLPFAGRTAHRLVNNKAPAIYLDLAWSTGPF